MIDNPYAFTDLNGFTPHISRLAYMMNYARLTTLQAVKGLSQEDLDAHLFEEGNSVGMLLEHIAAVEMYYQNDTLPEVTLSDEQKARWKVGGLGERGRREVRGHDLPYYLEHLAATRARTLTAFAARDDTWLQEGTTWDIGWVNNHWKWFHVLEDEVNHRGQIRVIRKQLRVQPSTAPRG